jgi:MFS family permease
MVWRFVPDFKPGGKQTFDTLGAVTLFLSLVSLLFALTLGQRIGFREMSVLALLAAWLILLLIFIWIELRASQPMIDLALFKNRLFSVNLVTGLATFIAIAGSLILIPFYLENVVGLETRQVGLLLAVVPVALGITAPLSGSLSDRLGTRPITVLGLVILSLGYLLLSQVDSQTSILGFVLRFLPIGIGMGIFQSPNNSAVMGTVPRERLGVASGLLSITRSLGQTSGIAVLGAVWAARVAIYAGGPLVGGATTADPAAQVAGLQDTFMTVMVMMFAALGLSVWGLFEERRLRRVSPALSREQEGP